MMEYDVLLFSGGNACILLDEINRTGFNEVMIQAVENGLFYLGISAGSMIATGNIPNNLGYVNNPIIVHCENGTIYLTDTQEIWIEGNNAQIIE